MAALSLAYMFWLVFSASGQVLEFVAYGDWGDATRGLKDTIASIKRRSPNRAFNLLLGDNFYPKGVSSVDDPKFAIFTDIVLGDTQLVHHMLLGNHDYMSDASAQIEYSNVNKYWDLPSRYYKRVYFEEAFAVCLIMLDTSRWDSAQVSWVEEQLASAECDPRSSWTIVSGHYPIWSAGEYKDRPYLKSDLLPLLHKYGVQLYLSGHEHLHEVFYDGSLVQVTSGAVCGPRDKAKFKPHPLLIWGLSGGPEVIGYVLIQITTVYIGIEIVSSVNDADFVSFAITRSGNMESMFGHIDWSSTKNYSASDLFATGAPTNYPTSVSSPKLARTVVPITVLIFLFIVVVS